MTDTVHYRTGINYETGCGIIIKRTIKVSNLTAEVNCANCERSKKYKRARSLVLKRDSSSQKFRSAMSKAENKIRMGILTSANQLRETLGFNTFELCRVCGNEVKVMILTGTGFCSENCWDEWIDAEHDM